MVESLKELRIKCQKPRYKEIGNWMARHIVRDLALPITWLLLHTRITANQVTLISIFAGLASSIAFMIPNPTGFFTGACLLQIWYLLDHVDGQIARYHGTSSLTGVYFDFITHYLVHSFVFLGLGVGAYFASGSPGVIFLGALAALFMAFLSMFYDAKWKAFYHWFELKKVKQAEFNWPDEKPSPQRLSLSKGEGRVRVLFSLLCKLTEIHVIMNLLTLLAVIGFWLPVNFSFPVTILYAVLLPFVFTVRVIHAIKNKTPDETFQNLVKQNV